MTNAAQAGGISLTSVGVLLNLVFLELDVLPHDRIVFPHAELFRLSAWVFLGDVVIACVRRADELDQNSTILCHGLVSVY